MATTVSPVQVQGRTALFDSGTLEPDVLIIQNLLLHPQGHVAMVTPFKIRRPAPLLYLSHECNWGVLA